MAEKQKSSPFDLTAADFAATAKKRIEELANAQTELFKELQEANQHWLDCIQAETNLVSEFASKLTAARSIPDAMVTCQEWGSRQFQIIADDTMHLASDAQKLMQIGARILSTGWQSREIGFSK